MSSVASRGESYMCICTIQKDKLETKAGAYRKRAENRSEQSWTLVLTLLLFELLVAAAWLCSYVVAFCFWNMTSVFCILLFVLVSASPGRDWVSPLPWQDVREKSCLEVEVWMRETSSEGWVDLAEDTPWQNWEENREQNPVCLTHPVYLTHWIILGTSTQDG